MPSELGFCPILKENCVGPRCTWCVVLPGDDDDDLVNCAVTIMALPEFKRHAVAALKKAKEAEES